MITERVKNGARVKLARRPERETFWTSATELTEYISAEAHGCRYLVQVKDQNAGYKLFVRQHRTEMEILERAVGLLSVVGTVAGRQFLDVGANIGTTTVPALRLHGFGTAICFEPEAQNVLTLRLNLLLNGLEERAQVMQVALSDEVGIAQLAVDEEKSGKSHLMTNSKIVRRRALDTTAVTVNTLTLDGLVEDGTVDPEGVGLLWIDAQGHEGHILKGAKSLVEQGVPVVLEWNPQALERHGSGIEELAAEHYTHFLDVRNSVRGHGSALRPSEALREYGKGFGDRKYTDILLLRLSSDQARQLTPHLTHSPKLTRAQRRVERSCRGGRPSSFLGWGNAGT